MTRMRWRIALAAVVVAGAAANHVEHYLRAKRVRSQAQAQDAPVVQQASNALGHDIVQIDEQSLNNRDFLHFSTLESWTYTPQTPATCPEAVQAVNGQQVKMLGFMYPQGDPKNLRAFCLLRSTQTCCYGPRPQYNQYVFVQSPEPVKFERLAPVVVQGRFFVDPNVDDGYIYRMECQSVRAATGNDQPPSAEEFARQVNLPIFDLSVLEQIQRIKDPADRQDQIVRQLAPLAGRAMVVHGYVIRGPSSAGSKGPSSIDPGQPARFTIGKYPELKALSSQPGLFSPVPGGQPGSLGPLGSPAGGPLGSKPPAGANPPPAPAAVGLAPASRPDNYNTVQVWPRGQAETPPAWWPEAAFKGTIQVTTRPEDWRRDGIISLRDATLAAAPPAGGLLTDAGLMLPMPLEALFLAASGLGVLLGVFAKGSANGGRA